MADGLRGRHTRQGNNTNKGWAWAHLANYTMQLEQNGRGQGALEGAGPEEPYRVIVKLQGHGLAHKIARFLSASVISG